MSEDRRTDTEKTFSDQPLGGSESGQQPEEAPPSEEPGEQDRATARHIDRLPSEDHPHAPDGAESPPGAAGEGTQSTGHPENAG